MRPCVGWIRRPGWWPVWAVSLLGLWVVLTGDASAAELLAGGVAAGTATVAAELVRRQGLLRFVPEAGWLLRARRLPAAALRDVWIVGVAVWRAVVRREPVVGAFRAVPFDWGRQDPRGAARRALIVTALSATSNTYVVGIDRGEDVILIHQLVPDERTRAAEALQERL